MFKLATTRYAARWAVLSLLLLATIGCQTARIAEPLTANLQGDSPEAQVAFWHTLAERKVVSNDEAFHGLLLFLDDEDKSPDYAARLATLKDRGLVASSFDRPAEESVFRGTLAVAIMKTLEIKGGVITRVFGASPRYSLRELQTMNLFPPGSPRQPLSGNEFVAIIGRMEDYQMVVASIAARKAPAPQQASDAEVNQ